MGLECCEYSVVVPDGVEEVVVGRLAEAFVGRVVDGLQEVVEEVWLDVGRGVEAAAVDVAECLFELFVGNGVCLLGSREVRLAFVPIVEVLYYQFKGAPSVGAGTKKGFSGELD